MSMEIPFERPTPVEPRALKAAYESCIGALLLPDLLTAESEAQLIGDSSDLPLVRRVPQVVDAFSDRYLDAPHDAASQQREAVRTVLQAFAYSGLAIDQTTVEKIAAQNCSLLLFAWQYTAFRPDKTFMKQELGARNSDDYRRFRLLGQSVIDQFDRNEGRAVRVPEKRFPGRLIAKLRLGL